MVYKKFIKIGGKKYGPYYYESYRENGKIKKRYVGYTLPSKEKTLAPYHSEFKSLFLPVILGLIFVGLLFAIINLEYTVITGKALANLDNNVFTIQLKHGELLPANTQIVINSASGVFEIPLSELLSDQSISAQEGNFYVENKAISGYGFGYGIEGYKILQFETPENTSTNSTTEPLSQNNVTPPSAEVPAGLTITGSTIDEYEYGFGSDYLNNAVYEIQIDLSQLNLDDISTVSIVYDGTEIASSTQVLEEPTPVVPANMSLQENIPSEPSLTIQDSVSDCQTLSSADTTYTLTNNVQSNGTCFNLANSNITLDCAGYSITGNGSGYGISTKLDIVWNKTAGTTNSETAYGVAVDLNNNNIVTGRISNGVDADVWTIKYYPNGTQIWNRTAGKGSYGYDDIGSDVVVDSNNNIVVTGFTKVTYPGSNFDIWTIKYDENGTQLWNKTIGGSSEERGYGIDIDSHNNVIVTGDTQSFGAGNWDILTVKYDENGTQLWNKTLGSSSGDQGRDVAIDSKNNIIVAGYTDSGGSESYQIWTIKYDENGAQLWNKTFGTRYAGVIQLDIGEGVAVDSEDNIIVSGHSGSFGSYNSDAVLTIKYDKNGTQIWNKTTVGVIAFKYIGVSEGFDVAVDSMDNIIVHGYTNISGEFKYDFWTTKYNKNGYLLWNKVSGGDGGYEFGQDVAVDLYDNIILTGSTQSFGAGQYDMWTVKYTEGSSSTLQNCTISNFTQDIKINSSAGIKIKNSLIGNYDFSNAGLIFENTSNGKIKYLAAITQTGANLSADIAFAQNLISVDSSKSGLNTSAELSLYNLSFGNAYPLRNGQSCLAPICTRANYNYSTGTLRFNVLEFTNYSAEGFSPGATITNNLTLSGNLLNSTGGTASSGLVIGADNITVDCNGYNIGLNITNKDNIVIDNCSISGSPESFQVFSSTIIIKESVIESYNLSNTNLTLLDTGKGKIEFLGGVTASGTNMSADILISPNFISVNSANSPGFNQSAILTFYNVPEFDYPQILVNGAVCSPSICTVISGLGTPTVVFNVTHFTNYSINNTIICGDNVNVSGVFGGDLQNSTGGTICPGNGLVIDADNIVVDCAGFNITGSGGLSQGINLSSFSNVTIKNCNIQNFGYGIYLNSASGNNITNNTASISNLIGIYLATGSNNTVSNNDASSNVFQGIQFFDISDSTISDNIANSNGDFGIEIEYGSNNTIVNNTVSENGIYGFYIFFSSNNIIFSNTASSNIDTGIYMETGINNNIISNNTFNSNDYGIHLNQGLNNTLSDNIVSSNNIIGISLRSSLNNTFSNNAIISNNDGGIYLDSSSDNTISNNNASSNGQDGINLASSSNNNIISGNILISNNIGIRILSGSSQNTISNNTASSNGANGIYLYSSSYNTISNNNVSSNNWGIYLEDSLYNTISNNTVSSNTFTGIDFSGSSNNTISNNLLNLNQNGILFYLSNNNIISNNTATSNEDGLLFDESSFNTISNNTFSSNNHNGIDFQSESENNIIFNNNVSSNGNYGLSVSSSSNNTISNNLVNSNSDTGLQIHTSSNNTISNNIISSNINYGMHIYYVYASPNRVFNNFFNNSANLDVDSYRNFWNTTINCTGSHNIIGGNCTGGNYWANLDGTGFSENATACNADSNGVCTLQYDITDNGNNTDYLPLTLLEEAGISCGGTISTSIIFTENLTGCSGNGLVISADNIVVDCAGHKIIGNGAGYGILISGLSNVTIKNCSISNFSSGIYFNSSAMTVDDGVIGSYNLSNTNLTLLNAGVGKIEFLGGITESGTNLSADVIISPNLISINSDNRPGFNQSAILTLYNVPAFTHPRIFRNNKVCPESICTVISGLGTSTVVFNVTQFTNYSINTTIACGDTVSTSGIFDEDLHNSTGGTICPGTGLTIGANNIIVDCGGYAINGSGGSNGIYLSSRTNVTIQNCNIKNFGNGVQFFSSNNITIINSNLNGSGYGVDNEVSSYNQIINSTVYGGSYGMYLYTNPIFYNSVGNSIVNSTVSGASGGMYLYQSSNVQVINTALIGSTASGYGIYAYGATWGNHNISIINSNLSGYTGFARTSGASDSQNVSITNSFVRGVNTGLNFQATIIKLVNSTVTSNNYGIYDGSSNSQVINSTIISTNYGIYLSSGTNYSIIGSTISVNASAGQGVYFGVSGSQIINSNISTNGSASYAAYFNGASNNNITNSTFNAAGNNSRGLYITGGTNNQIANSSFIVIGNNSYGFYLTGGSTNNQIVSSAFDVTGTNSSGVFSDSSSNVIFKESAIDGYNFNNARLAFEDAGEGKIEFLSGITQSGTNLSADVVISPNLISVNSSKTGLNQSANLTLYNVPAFGNPKIFRNGQICASSICTVISGLGTSTVKFNVTQFTNYSINDAEIITNLSINYTTPLLPNEPAFFFANYTDNSSEVTGATCNITFTGGSEEGTGQQNMDYNATAGLYYLNRSFVYSGNYSLNVICSKAGYTLVNASGTIGIKIQMDNSLSVGMITNLSTINENENVNISVTIPASTISSAYAGYNLNNVWTQLYMPNGTALNLSLSGSLSGGLWNLTYNHSGKFGNYNLTFFANLTNGFGLVQLAQSNFSVQNVNITIIAPASAYTNDTINVRGRIRRTLGNYRSITGFIGHVINSSAGTALSVYAIDLDGDGDIDVLSALRNLNATVWYENNGTGGGWPGRIINSSANSSRSVFAIDLDGDGDNDVLSASQNDNKIAWYENNGTGGGWIGKAINSSATLANSVYAIDLDNDSDNDVLSASFSTIQRKIAGYINNGTGGGWPGIVINNSARAATSVYAADLDNDGDNDVLGAYVNNVSWYKNNGTGGGWPGYVINFSANGINSVYAADLDGDGDNDVLSASQTDNKIAWYENNGTGGGWKGRIINSSASFANSVFAIDLDGDGDKDVLSASGNDNKIAWYENNGTGGGWIGHIINSTAVGAQSVYAIDLDGDGDKDVLSASRDDNKIAWYETLSVPYEWPLENNSLSIAFGNATFNISTDSAGEYDYNITVPTDSLGLLPLTVAILQSPSGIVGNNSVNITVIARTNLSYSTIQDYSVSQTNYSVFANYKRTDLNTGVNGAVSVNVFNGTGIQGSKNCTTGLCLVSWTIPGELGQGNYTVNITADNELAYYQNASVQFEEYLYEINKTWTVTPQSINATKTVSKADKLQDITVSNLGNVNLSFIVTSSNYSLIQPNVTTIFLRYLDNQNIQLNYSTPAVESSYLVNIMLTNASANPPQINITINLTATKIALDIITPNSTSQITDVVPSQFISSIVNATYTNLPIDSNSSWNVTIGGKVCENINSTYVPATTLWNISCDAPNVSDGLTYNFTLTILHDIHGQFSQTSENSIVYKDFTYPYFNLTRNNIEKNQSINLTIKVIENAAVDTAYAYIIYPNATWTFNNITNITTASNVKCKMSPLGNSVFNCTSLVLDLPGEYLVNYTANDTAGLFNSTTDWFEVYDRYNWTEKLVDYASNPIAGVNLSFYRLNSTEILFSNVTNSNGQATFLVNKRFYDLQVSISGDKLIIRNVNFTNLTAYNMSLNIHRIAGIDMTDIPPLYKPFYGFVSNSTGLSNNWITLVFNYSGLNYDTAAWLRIIKCPDWNYSTRTCINNIWIKLDSSRNSALTQITGNASGFSAYFLAEDKCGNGLCEVVYSETTANCPNDCKATSFAISAGGGGSIPQAITDEDLRNLEKLIKGTIDVGGVRLETTSIYKELFAGDTTSFRIKVINTLNTNTVISLSSEGDVKPFIFFENNQVELLPNEARDVMIKVIAPQFMDPGNYDGDLILKSNDKTGRIPVTLRVLSPEGKLLDVKIQPLTPTIAPGGILLIQTDIMNLGKTKKVDVQFDLQLADINTGEIITRFEEAFAVETSFSTVKNLTVPENIKTGKYMIKGTAYYSNIEQSMQASSIAYIEVQYPFFKRRIFGISMWVYSLIALLIAMGLGIYFYLRWLELRMKRFKVKIELNKLPQPGSNSAFVGKIAETGIRAFMDMNKLQMHTLVAGATGGGKTIVAQDIVEAALLNNKSVVVIDPTAQWTGFLKKCEDKSMLKRYSYFDMKPKDVKSFNGIIKTIHDPYELINIKDYFNRPGEITIFNVSNLTPKEIDLVVASTIEQIFKSQPEESKELKTLMVYDEVHRLLPKFGGSGQGFIQLERGAREFRKWGIGLVLISQVLSDFVGEIKANIGTEVQMGTRYEGDLERVSIKYGEDVLKSVVREPIGTGMVVNAEYNSGRPYFISFRPLLHSTRRLSNEELKTYEKYFNLVEDLEYQLSKLKAFNIDVLDLELEIKLAKNKVKEGQFQMADMYFETIVPRIEDHWKKIKKAPMHFVRKKISKEEVEAGIKKAKLEREKHIKKNPQAKISIEQELISLKRKLEEKKKEGKNTNAIEMKLNDFASRFKNFKGKLNDKDNAEILKEVNAMKEEAEKLK